MVKTAVARQVELDLRSSNIGTLEDDELSWPTNGKLKIEGLQISRNLSRPTD